MTEADYKDVIVGALEYHGFKAERHEDKVTNFIPDISFAGNKSDGWMEVKWCEKDPTSLGALHHWTKGQEAWLYDRGRVGSGHCYLLVGTPRRNILWRYDALSTVRGQSFEAALHYACHIDAYVGGLADFLRRMVRPPARVPV